MRTIQPALPMTGGCQCGAIRYQIASFPLLLYACNCTNCQRQSGSAFALNMPIIARDFHVVQGAPKGWHHTSPTGVPVISWFCEDCGGRLYGDRAGRADVVNLRAGTLDDTTWLTPVAHIFMKSAQDWVYPAEGAECHEAGPTDFNSASATWRAMWPEFFRKKIAVESVGGGG
jgi:hypothetical protein